MFHNCRVLCVLSLSRRPSHSPAWLLCKWSGKDMSSVRSLYWRRTKCVGQDLVFHTLVFSIRCSLSLVWQTNRQKDWQTERRTDRQLGRQTDRQLDRRTIRQKERQTSRQIQTDRHTVKQTGRQRDGKTDRLTNTQTGRHNKGSLGQELKLSSGWNVCIKVHYDYDDFLLIKSSETEAWKFN